MKNSFKYVLNFLLASKSSPTQRSQRNSTRLFAKEAPAREARCAEEPWFKNEWPSFWFQLCHGPLSDPGEPLRTFCAFSLFNIWALGLLRAWSHLWLFRDLFPNSKLKAYVRGDWQFCLFPHVRPCSFSLLWLRTPKGTGIFFARKQCGFCLPLYSSLGSCTAYGMTISYRASQACKCGHYFLLMLSGRHYVSI